MSEYFVELGFKCGKVGEKDEDGNEKLMCNMPTLVWDGMDYLSMVAMEVLVVNLLKNTTEMGFAMSLTKGATPEQVAAVMAMLEQICGGSEDKGGPGPKAPK